MTSVVPTGILIVSKPIGRTSTHVVRVVKRILGNVKVGHCGTLDPLAGGVLVLVFGHATKWQAHLMGQDKRYEGTFRLGWTTDTWDVTGRVLVERPVPPLTMAALQQVCAQLTGRIEQIPPMFSARRVGGRRLYLLARQGKEVPRPARPVTVQEFSLLAWEPPCGTFRVHCSSGTYVRSLIHELGERVGTGATLASLRRERVGEFTLAQALPWEELKQATKEQLLRYAFLPPGS